MMSDRNALKPALVLLMAMALVPSIRAQTGKWSVVGQTGKPIGREECSFAQAGGKFYLIGGRGISPVQEYSPATKAWRNMANTPVELNHFQALSLHGLVYVICAFNGGYPHEIPVPSMYIFDPLTDTWIKGMTIPPARLRGSAGVAVYQDKIYVALGIKDGHSAGWVPWLDEYDPATGEWKALPDAPRERDHFQTAVANGKLYALGGRRSNYKPDKATVDIFATLEKVDVFDFATGAWSTLPAESDHPLKRSGSVLITLGQEIIVAGGGSVSNGLLAHKETHAFNTQTNAWRALAPLNTGRQVLGGVLNNGGIYLASGSGGSGGTPVLQDIEVFFMADSLPPEGEALVAGQIASAESPFNLGMAASGAKSVRAMSLKHVSGTQGVLIGSMQVTGDPAFRLKASPAFPSLVRPGSAIPVEIEFTSAGAIPGAAALEITLAVPKGVIVKVPLEANKTPIAVRAPAGMARRAGAPAQRFENGWYFLRNPAGNEDGQASKADRPSLSAYRDAMGKLRILSD
ncbi:MAG: Kelch repeat-containing protein [Fibrobacteres bacterium]|nr:Kelch repeat-containing protein [Fibrobacterota bacterium]